MDIRFINSRVETGNHRSDSSLGVGKKKIHLKFESIWRKRKQKTHWPKSALIQEGCQEGCGIHRWVNLEQSRRYFLSILIAPDTGRTRSAELGPISQRRGLAGCLRGSRRARLKPQARSSAATNTSQPAGRTAALYQVPPAGWDFRLYQLDSSKVGPEGRSPPQAGACGWWAGARGCVHASPPRPRRALTLASSSWAPRACASMFRCLVFPLWQTEPCTFLQIACVCSAIDQQLQDCRWWPSMRPVSPSSKGSLAGGGGGRSGDAVTWAEPQDLAVDSEGSYSSLRLSFVRWKMSWATIQPPSSVF